MNHNWNLYLAFDGMDEVDTLAYEYTDNITGCLAVEIDDVHRGLLTS